VQTALDFPVMYNDIGVIDPKSNPAGIKAWKTWPRLQSVKATLFISRDDRPGTHTAELDLWQAAAIHLDRDKGPWYRSIG
jgi:tungstate transport system substrate-binding protein